MKKTRYCLWNAPKNCTGSGRSRQVRQMGFHVHHTCTSRGEAKIFGECVLHYSNFLEACIKRKEDHFRPLTIHRPHPCFDYNAKRFGVFVPNGRTRFRWRLPCPSLSIASRELVSPSLWFRHHKRVGKLNITLIFLDMWKLRSEFKRWKDQIWLNQLWIVERLKSICCVSKY